VIFGPHDAAPTLRAEALEAIGLTVDADTQALTCAREP
jgi:hypothetical protein